MKLNYQKFYKKLDRKSWLERIATPIPFIGFNLEYEGRRGRRLQIEKKCRDRLDAKDNETLNRALTEYNQDKLDQARTRDCVLKAVVGTSSLIGTGMCIGYYLAQ